MCIDICVYIFYSPYHLLYCTINQIKYKMEQTLRTPSKDELIVRQSQLQRAVEIYTLTGQRPTVQQICRLSQILTEFIFTWDEKSKGIKDFDNHINGQLKKDLVTDLTKVK